MEPDSLLELADDAAAASEYEAACHLLMAALHLAEHRSDQDAVVRIGAAGRRIGVAAKKRGHSAIFDQLDAHAEAVRSRLARTARA